MDKFKEISNFLNYKAAPDNQPSAAALVSDIRVFGVIDEAALYELDAALQNSPADVELLINSGGGGVFDGVAMSALIKRHQGQTTATGVGFVASIASVILLSADRVRLNKDAFLMIHNAWTFSAGDADELRKDAEILDKISDKIADIYTEQVQKNNKLIDGDYDKTKKKIKKMMSAETWFNASEAFVFGLIDEVADVQTQDALAAENLHDFVNKYAASAPKQFLNKYTKPMQNENEQKPSFWEQLKAYFKAEPQRVQDVLDEVQNEVNAAEASQIANAIETTKAAGFVVIMQSEATANAEQLNEAKTALDEANAENERLKQRLAELEAEANAPTAKAKIENAAPKTAREAILAALGSKIQNSNFLNNLNS